jgi:hypothetical protein
LGRDRAFGGQYCVFISPKGVDLHAKSEGLLETRYNSIT